MAAGGVGVAQVRELARAHANPRCGEAIAEALDELVDSAVNDDFEVFATLRSRLGTPGRLPTAPTATATPPRRAAGVAGGVLVTRCTSTDQFGAVQGEAMQTILTAFAEAEFAADWDEVRARFGDQACPAHLGRTEAQRRADALFAIFVAAATAPRRRQGTRTARAHRRRPGHVRTTDRRPRRPVAPAPPTGRPDRRRHPTTAWVPPGPTVRPMCHTAAGLPVDPLDAVVAADRRPRPPGRRRHRRLVIDLGRRARCFTGSARDAAVVQAWLDRLGRCLWPGCRLNHCQIDHTVQLVRPRPHQPGQQRPGLRPPQPVQDPRLHHPPRPPRPLAHLPTRRHRDPRRLTMTAPQPTLRCRPRCGAPLTRSASTDSSGSTVSPR